MSIWLAGEVRKILTRRVFTRAVTLLLLAAGGCGGDDDGTGGGLFIFNGEANRLNAYDSVEPFAKQTVIERASLDPDGRDINGQICFTRASDGSVRFIAGEDTNQPEPPPGWGFFQLDGHRIGEFSATQLGKLTPTYQTGPRGAENYGCGFLSDGRLVTTDVGAQASGPPDGQLIMWFPPFDDPSQPPRYCKIDVAIGTAQGVAIDQDDRVYVASARTEPGIHRYSGSFPTSDDAAGGCGRTDDTGAPLVDEGAVTKELYIRDSANVITPVGIVLIPGGGSYVSSVLNGVIAQYDAQGQFVRRILEPLPGSESIPPYPETGTPLGLGLASDGTLYFADIGLQFFPVPEPGPNLGGVRRIRFVEGQPQPPDIIDSQLNFPDGIGLLEE
jgi:hypothetical protein